MEKALVCAEKGESAKFCLLSFHSKFFVQLKLGQNILLQVSKFS